jgi:hypothetical protein
MSKVLCPKCIRLAKVVYYRFGGDRPVLKQGPRRGQRAKFAAPRALKRIAWVIYCYRCGIVRVSDGATLAEESPSYIAERAKANAPLIAALAARVRGSRNRRAGP